MAKAKQALEKPVWLKMKEDDLKKIIAELAQKNSPSQIGMILRDQYGVPTARIFGKKLSSYLKEAGIETNAELENARKKLEKLRMHLKKHITDKKAKHKIQKAQSRVKILTEYFEK